MDDAGGSLKSLSKILKKNGIPKNHPVYVSLLSTSKGYQEEGHKLEDANRGALQDLIDETKMERVGYLEQIKKMLGWNPRKQTTSLDEDTARAILKEAGGDKEKARKLARSRGHQF